jgi:hypothetical protein
MAAKLGILRAIYFKYYFSIAIGHFVSTVADTGCLSQIPDPDFYPSRIPDFESRIPDLGSKNSNKREGGKKISCHTFFCSHKFHITENYFILEMLKKKIWANFQRITELFNKIIVTKLSKIWVWDLGSEIRDSGSRKNLFRIPDPGVKKSPDPGSGSATLFVTIRDSYLP